MKRSIKIAATTAAAVSSAMLVKKEPLPDKEKDQIVWV